MAFVSWEEPTKSPSIPCKFFLSALKDAFGQCHVFPIGRQSPLSLEDENPTSDIEDDQAVIILAVRSGAMKAKLRRKGSLTMESLCWVLSPATGELFIAPKGGKDEDHEEEDEDEAFFSVKSCFSHSSSASGVECKHVRSRSVLEEFCYLEGWPFGLYRKMMMLPPLPLSPSESWSWYRGNQTLMMS
ncbi:uncharacterized protein LOC131235946 [Magnolia sinica]|uniref:uncharacterized protein LOC131235946 n=1 Tax=Magnolia sinica TaxID=86752 RepID=UPI0026587D00|nr:uncharacterized protein LOC131235946 [Magnolia sinica]